MKLMGLVHKLTDGVGLTSAMQREFNSLPPDSQAAISTMRELAKDAQSPWQDASSCGQMSMRGAQGFSVVANGPTYEVFESYGRFHHDFGFKVTEGNKEIAYGRESRCAQDILEAVRAQKAISNGTMPSGFRGQVG